MGGEQSQRPCASCRCHVQVDLARVRERLDAKLKHAPNKPPMSEDAIQDRIDVSGEAGRRRRDAREGPDSHR